MMQELEQILRQHAARYPVMQPTDAVKLIYQNEFGGGHLIRDEDACIHYLRKEHAATEFDPDLPKYEDIGNGIVRVYLAAVKTDELGQLGRDFIRSAREHCGTPERFLRKLTVLTELTAEGIFAFDTAALDAYLSTYGQTGFAPVSHSDTYRHAYRPAYRIICKELRAEQKLRPAR